MPHRNHIVIWIDHLQARIFEIGLTGVSSEVVHSHLSTQHLHHKANTIGSGHVTDDPDFLSSIEKTIGSAEQILILGPSTEKTSLKAYLDMRPTSPARSISIEPADHLTDNEIVALARKHFHLQPVRYTS